MEIIDYKKKPAELLIEFEDGTRKTFPLDRVEAWAEAEDVLCGVKDSVDYDGSHKQEVYELDFIDFYDCEMGIDDVKEFYDYSRNQ